MPIRDYLYNALNYAAQVEEIRKKHIEANDLTDPAELLSGFTKKDKLIPVITLCICFDKAKWDAPRSLYEMFGKVDPRIRQYVDDYRLNLITPGEIKDFGKFTSELGLLLEFIQYSDDKKRMSDIMETRKEYRSVDVRTVDLINTYTAANISTKAADEEGRVNMCTAFKEIREDARAEGHTEERTEIIDYIKKQQASGVSPEQILQSIIKMPNKKTTRQRRK